MLNIEYFQFRLLRKTTDNEVKELVTGVLWNLSSCDVRIQFCYYSVILRIDNTLLY